MDERIDLSEEDQDALDFAIDGIIDAVAAVKSFSGCTGKALAVMLQELDYAKFVVSGIVYSNEIDTCVCDEEHEE